MKMEVTELGPMKRALKIEVPVEEVAQRFVQAYKELNRQVRVPGFRPGKAPQALLEQRYAKAVEEDVVRSLVPDYYDRAVRQAGISPEYLPWSASKSSEMRPSPSRPQSRSNPTSS
jgi:trigger factor